MSIKTISSKTISTCPNCGTARERIGAGGRGIIEEFLARRGKTLEETARNFEATSGGGFLWAHGGGYAIFEEDVLGGAGTGHLEDEFRAETGARIIHLGGSGAATLCEGCADAAIEEMDEEEPRSLEEAVESMAGAIQAHREAGGFFFDGDAMEFFDSRVYADTFNPATGHFITSEDMFGSGRRFAARRMDLENPKNIATVATGLPSREAALEAIRADIAAR